MSQADPERLQQLRQLLADAQECGDVDKITEVLSNIALEFPGEADT